MNTNIIKSLIIRQGLTVSKLAKMLEMSAPTLYKKIKTGIFRTNELARLMALLKVEELTIFLESSIPKKKKIWSLQVKSGTTNIN